MTDAAAANATHDSAESPKSKIRSQLRAFVSAMQATRDLEQFIRENAKEMFGPEAVFARIAARRMPGRDAAEHEAAAKLVHRLIHERMDAISKLRNAGASEERIVEEQEKYEKAISGGVMELTGRSADNYHYGQVWQRTTAQPYGGQVLRSSLLIGAVSDFEVLVSAIIRMQLAAAPEILRASEQTYSFKDLEAFGSLQEFREYCAERMADGLLRRSFEDWMDWFAKRHKIPVPGVTDCPAELVEVFQRRHLFVHNAGIVNDLYLTKVRGLPDPPPVGKQLRVEGDYLKATIDRLTVAGVKLFAGVFRKTFSDEGSLRDLDSLLSGVIYILLQDGRYAVVKELADYHLTFVASDETRLVAMTNRWLATKSTNGLAAIEDEVRKWDTSTLAGRFRLVRLALLEKHEEAHALATRLIASGELQPGQWHTWPVLEGVREFAASRDDYSDPSLYDAPHSEPVDLSANNVPGGGSSSPDAPLP